MPISPEYATLQAWPRRRNVCDGQHLPITLERTCAPAYSQALQVTCPSFNLCKCFLRPFSTPTGHSGH